MRNYVTIRFTRILSKICKQINWQNWVRVWNQIKTRHRRLCAVGRTVEVEKSVLAKSCLVCLQKQFYIRRTKNEKLWCNEFSNFIEINSSIGKFQNVRIASFNKNSSFCILCMTMWRDFSSLSISFESNNLIGQW